MPYRCNFVSSTGQNRSTCCSDSAACVALKATRAQTSTGNRAIFYPTGKCGEGFIDTALGCIPYTTQEFGPALLGFLSTIVGAIALAIMLFSTIQIISSGGDAEALKKGKELFTGAVTGLLFIIFSVTLLKIIAGDVIKLPGFGLNLVKPAYAQAGNTSNFQIDYNALNSKIGLGGNVAGKDLGGVISALLPYIITLAGIILFGMLIFGGFTMLAGATDKESQEKGKKMITSAITGFILIFAAYWIAQILQVITGFSIVN